jgi:hypothetical protein
MQLAEGGLHRATDLDQQQTTVNNDQAAVRTAQANLQTAITNQQVNGNAGERPAGGDRRLGDRRRQRRARHRRTSPGQIAAVPDADRQGDDRLAVDGVVVNRNLNPGEYPGSRTIFTIQQLDHVYAELNASSRHVRDSGRRAGRRSASRARARAYTGTRRRGARPSDAGFDQLHRQGARREPDGKLQAGCR